ncbi:UDP-glucuronosyltransferase 2B14-like [Anoplophora glabripennis]|uniref:UDP-glucuronosyltransferase 2B14-like n=1 Tax=Anoplophora glabripennis TaxID=217634 RepID=UPI000C76CA2A|nr:UDP-glucuronosyltransferase 2B14-like [Anoplophora glabripennis]
MKTNLYSYLLFLINLTQSTSYNILGVFPHPGKSHVDVFKPLMKALAENGHKVTVISHFPLIKPIPNYKDIHLGSKEVLVDAFDVNIAESSRFWKINHVLLLSYIANSSCENGLASEAVQNFMKTKDRYDVMITEFFNSDCFLGLAHRVKAPIIGLSSSTLMSWTSERLANPVHTAYIPNNLMDYSDRMTFLERLENTVVTLYHQYYYKYFMLSRDNALISKHLGKKAAKVKEFIANTSLVLVNTHFSLNLPRPLVPNVIEVGGIHIRNQRPLSKVSD